MVSEHRAGPPRRITFEPDPTDPDEAHGSPEWARRLTAALARCGIEPATTGSGTGPVAVRPGEATASVQDEQVRVGCRPLPDDVWADLAAGIAADPWAAATLTSGRLPEPDVLPALPAALLPTSATELPLDCSCADWAMPCVHVRAVCAALTDRVAADPFVLAGWRGRERPDLVAAVRAAQAGPDPHALPLSGFHDLGGPLPPLGGRGGRVDAVLDELPPLGTALNPDGVTDAREVLRPLYRRLGGAPGPPAG